MDMDIVKKSLWTCVAEKVRYYFLFVINYYHNKKFQL
jgi:hypothetical protein